jgi:hypothetical protein
MSVTLWPVSFLILRITTCGLLCRVPVHPFALGVFCSNEHVQQNWSYNRG